MSFIGDALAGFLNLGNEDASTKTTVTIKNERVTLADKQPRVYHEKRVDAEIETLRELDKEIVFCQNEVLQLTTKRNALKRQAAQQKALALKMADGPKKDQVIQECKRLLQQSQSNDNSVKLNENSIATLTAEREKTKRLAQAKRMAAIISKTNDFQRDMQSSLKSVDIKNTIADAVVLTGQLDEIDELLGELVPVATRKELGEIDNIFDNLSIEDELSLTDGRGQEVVVKEKTPSSGRIGSHSTVLAAVTTTTTKEESLYEVDDFI